MMVEAVAIMGGLGVVIGMGLAAASKLFYVYVDPTIEAVESALPGANCGGCGLPGCSANAEAIVKGKASPNSCVAGGSDIAAAIAKILGVSVEAKEPDIARPGCSFGVQDADIKFLYEGMSDCRAAVLLSGGMKVCNIGCLGLGSCFRACPFGAITMGKDGLPVVDEQKCTGCGTCERVCPKHIITLSSVTRRIIREYTTDECTTPCQRSCPAGIDIREYIRQILLGDYRKSVQVIKERNPFPTVIGRICPRPCEESCRRQMVEEPVAINFLKRFASEYEKDSGKRIQPYMAPPTGKKIAVIGGGAQGLSAAFFSARLGHDATVFETGKELGGLLRTAIRNYRLSYDILDWDINGILEMGVTARTGMSLGKDFTIDSLLSDGFQTVFLATGGWDSRLTRGTDIEETIPGTYLLVDLFRADSKNSNSILIKNNVVIAGGGKLAMDAARLCMDIGAKSVTVLFRESEDEHPITIEDAESDQNEGITIVYHSGITRFFGKGNALESIVYMNLDTKETQTIPAQNLFLASGRLPELIFKKVTPPESEETVKQPEDVTETELQKPAQPIEWEAMLPYKSPAYADEVGMFSKGDVFTDFSAAIRAIAAGRRGAASIHQILYGTLPMLPENVLTPSSMIQDVDHVEQVKTKQRQIMPVCGTTEMETCGILEKGFSESMAVAEARRCLQCGLICYEKCQ